MNITIAQAIIGGISLFLSSIGGAYMTGSVAANKELSNTNTKVEVIKITEELHYKELKELLTSIDQKIDRIAPPTVTKTNAKGN